MKEYPWFVRGDLDGFLGLLTDNLLQLMVIIVLGVSVCGVDIDFLNGQIITGAAVSLIVGNLFYAWQARRVAIRTRNPNVTALPYGVNTPTVIVFIFFIMMPVYQKTGDTFLAWKTGVFACFISGVFEVSGAFFGDWLRRNTPRCAMLSALAGCSISIIAMGFIFQIFANPFIAFIPAFLLFAAYAAKLQFPFRLPAAVVAVFLGTVLAWVSRWAGYDFFTPSPEPYYFKFYFPVPVIGDLLGFLIDGEGWQYMSIIIPMALFNIIGSLENLESAAASGDCFETKSSLLVNGCGSILASFFGSPFPTTIYIGHPGWKEMGARYGYSILNGVFITGLALIGGITLILKFIPIEALLGILLWIGLIIMSQAYQTTNQKYALAVSVGLIPSIAAWALLLIETTVQKCGFSLTQVAPLFGDSLYIYGVIALNQGYVLTSILFAAIVAFCIDREFLKAAAWSAGGMILSFFGVIHAYTLTDRGIDTVYGFNKAPLFTLAYAGLMIVFICFSFTNKNQNNKLNTEKVKI